MRSLTLVCNNSLANTFYQSKEYQDAHSILKSNVERQFQIIEGN